MGLPQPMKSFPTPTVPFPDPEDMEVASPVARCVCLIAPEPEDVDRPEPFSGAAREILPAPEELDCPVRKENCVLVSVP